MSLDFNLYAYKVVNEGEEQFKGELFTANITHNLNKMANEAGIYYAAASGGP